MICFYPPFTWIMVLTLNNYGIDVQKTCFSQLNGFWKYFVDKYITFYIYKQVILNKLSF